MEKTSKTKKALYGLLAAIGVTAGAAGIAAAATSQSSPSTTTTTAATAGAEHGDPHDDDLAPGTSSITDRASVDEHEGVEEDDAAELARLEKLATVTPEEVKAAAIAEAPGTVKKVELESEDGNVVYDVEVATSAGEVDVTVDAGNAKVLKVEKETGEHDDDGHDD